MNPTARRCHAVITALCGQHPLQPPPEAGNEHDQNGVDGAKVDGDAQLQVHNAYSMMWPNALAMEADSVMQDDAWMEFLRAESGVFDDDSGW